MDAGVPIKKSVAGVAMGLIKEDNNFVVLTDILGDEDHLGDMDLRWQVQMMEYCSSNGYQSNGYN